MRALQLDWADLFENAPCGLLQLDSEYTIEVANAYAAGLLGRTAEELTGVRLYNLLSAAGRIFVQTRVWPELALSGRVEELALDLVSITGERIPVLCNASQPLADVYGPGRIRLAFTRAAAKRAYEAEVPKARLAAEAASRVKGDFLANVSHEIRTPLNGVIGVAGALERTTLTSTQREMVELIQSSGAMLERLVSDILDLSKVEAGGLELEMRPFQLRAELGGVLELARIRAEEKGVAFVAEFDAASAGWFEGDAVRLKQVLGNLTSNAVKFTASGEVRVCVAVEPGEPSATVVLTVADTGVGFDEAVGDTLFRRFHQADAGITRRYGGTGLGLSICKALTDLMGGTITARSQPGRGSRFQVRAPLQPCASVRDETSETSTATPGDLCILLVEDHPANQKVVALILAPHGVELTVADDGLQGLDVWRSGVFDLVLMDMQMPVMDGLSAVRAIRAEEASGGRRRTPVAVLSANAMEHHRQEAMAAGADLHIAKPVTPASLLEGIARMLALDPEAAAA